MQLQTQNNHRFHAAAAIPVEHTTAPNDQHVDALANLAAATASDRMALANLTATNERLSVHIEKLTAQLAAANLQIRTLQASNPTAQPARGDKRACQQVHYCWTHGFRVKLDGSHTSKTYTTRRPCHKKKPPRIIEWEDMSMDSTHKYDIT